MLSTADLYDQFKAQVSTSDLQFRQYGAVHAFFGRIATVRCFEDNVLLKKTLSEPAAGRVLVVDGGGSLGAALMGDNVAALGVQNGWAGVIIRGAVRDTRALAGLAIGIKALGSNPRPSRKTGAGEVDVPLLMGGAAFVPGHWLYSDEDGILVSPVELELE